MSFTSSTHAANKKKRRQKRTKKSKSSDNNNTKEEYTSTKEQRESFAGDNKYTTTSNAIKMEERQIRQGNNADNKDEDDENGKESENDDEDVGNDDDNEDNDDDDDGENDDDLLDEDDDDDLIESGNILALVTKSSKDKNNDNDNDNYYTGSSKVHNASFRVTRMNTIQGSNDGPQLQPESQHQEQEQPQHRQPFNQTNPSLVSNAITRTEAVNYTNKYGMEQTDSTNSKANAEWRNILYKQTVGCLFFHVTSRLLDLVVGFLKVNNIHASFSVFRAFEHPFVNTILHHPRIVRHTSPKTKHQLRHLKVFFATKERNAG